jgi:hypothetical protein
VIICMTRAGGGSCSELFGWDMILAFGERVGFGR